MPEMPDAREDHRDSGAVGGGDHVVVLLRATGLNHRSDARARGGAPAAIAAMQEARKGDLKSYPDFKALLADLDADD